VARHDRIIEMLGVGRAVDAGSERIGLRDEVGGLDGGSAFAYLIEKLHGPRAVVASAARSTPR
jgi:hypothetical protein